MSDQPASCPLCGAIIRQSRNLRRHLELLHFGLGGNGKPGAGSGTGSGGSGGGGSGSGAGSGHHATRSRRSDRSNDFVRSSLSSIRPHIARTDFSHHTRSTDNPEFPAMPPLSIPSAISTGTSSASLAGNLMGPGPGGLLTNSGGGNSEQNGNNNNPGQIGTVPSNPCPVVPTVPAPNNGFYSTDGSASMLSCLLPSLPTLPSLSTSHDVFRHGEMLRAGIAYHDSSRQHSKHMQRTDVT